MNKKLKTLLPLIIAVLIFLGLAINDTFSNMTINFGLLVSASALVLVLVKNPSYLKE
jgi:cytochrome c-type biogenesis protein CcmE